MQVPVIRIGNSKGILFSKTIMKKYQITDSVDLIMEDEYISIQPHAKPRQNWGNAFADMNSAGDDKLMIDDVFADETFEE